MDYEKNARELGKHFDWGAKSEQVNEVAAALRESAADALSDAADYIRKVRCGKKPDTDLFNASSEFELRSASLRALNREGGL